MRCFVAVGGGRDGRGDDVFVFVAFDVCVRLLVVLFDFAVVWSVCVFHFLFLCARFICFVLLHFFGLCAGFRFFAILRNDIFIAIAVSASGS